MSHRRLVTGIAIATLLIAALALVRSSPHSESPSANSTESSALALTTQEEIAPEVSVDAKSSPPGEATRHEPEWRIVAEQLRREARQETPAKPVTRGRENAAMAASDPTERRVAHPPADMPRGIKTEIAIPIASVPPPTPTSEETVEPSDEDDNSDRKAPSLERLLFTPNRVRDGGNSVLTITASDDLSGIVTVAGTITSPSGKSVTSFTAVRLASGSDYAATISVPVGAEQGRWYIRRLQIIDRAGNTLDTTWTSESSFPSGILQVDSKKTDPDELTLRSVYLEKRSIDAGDRNTVFVDVVGGATGIQGVHGVFRNPRKTARTGFGCRYDQARSLWIGEIAIPPGAECGEWVLDQIQVVGKANERTTFDSANSTVRGVSFQVGGDGPCDSAPPVVVWLSFSPGSVPNTGGSVAVTAFVTDDKSGVQAVSGRVEGPTPLNSSKSPQLYFALRASGNPSEWVGVVRVPNHAAKGVWYVSAIQAIDKSGNQKVYTRGQPPVGTIGFQVE